MVVVGGWAERADMEDRLEVRRWCAGAGGASKGGDEERSQRCYLDSSLVTCFGFESCIRKSCWNLRPLHYCFSHSLFQKTSRTSICRAHDTNEGLMMNGEDER
ncbi:hypothetical protein HZH66_009913 [Vespula vulgaris]|uniref:Uncharacterized protein n=1 Tax=Vespula vulgaris TaxID=7454 RepID=A0A834JI09_VESVU|nr:hypothetical protein HZH66_009913 [Vespula vulgaris]